MQDHDDILSKAFHGRHGRAMLFNDVVNVRLGPAVRPGVMHPESLIHTDTAAREYAVCSPQPTPGVLSTCRKSVCS